MGKATRWLRGLLGMKKDKESVDNSNSSDRKDEKRWSFAKSGTVGRIPAPDTTWLRSYISETEKEQNKHAIAVAAATAAAADAAVAAAQAAVAVVRLTGQGRGTLFAGGREKWAAAVKIQTVFRGYLSQKALRALKGLVKLQALVRGYLVRKRATATLHSMQALIRAQTAVRSQRARRSFNKAHPYPENPHRKYIESVEEKPKVEYYSKRLLASYETTLNDFDERPKIVEIDTSKPKSRFLRMNTSASDSGEAPNYPTSSSPLPCPIHARLCIPDRRRLSDFEWGFLGDEGRFSTAQSTPRFPNSGRSIAPATPAKSVCGDSFFWPYSIYPGYMANTQSFRAKLRAHSAPKQRPDSGPKKKQSPSEIMAPRSSFCRVKMQRASSQVQGDFNF